MLVFASDLDNTLIYSHKRIEGDCICVEYKEGKELSYMTKSAYKLLQEVEKQLCFVPVTTRSLEQYQRIRLLGNKQPPYALVSNGGMLLKDGVIDRDWYQETLTLAERSRVQIEQAYTYLVSDQHRSFDIRRIDNLYLFTKSDCTGSTIEALNQRLDLSQISVIENYQKIYVIPNFLHKGLGVKRLREKLGDCRIIAAGDSSFDLPMLLEANYGITLDKTEFRMALEEKRQSLFWKGNKLGFSDFLLHALHHFDKSSGA